MINSAQIIDTSALLSINPELAEWIDAARTLPLRKKHLKKVDHEFGISLDLNYQP